MKSAGIAAVTSLNPKQCKQTIRTPSKRAQGKRKRIRRVPAFRKTEKGYAEFKGKKIDENALKLAGRPPWDKGKEGFYDLL